MKASLTNPIYTTKIINSSGTTFKIKNITTGLQLSQPEKELAQKVVVSFVNAIVNGKNINAQISLRDRVYVYANTGNGEKEVFRGFIWTKKYDSETEKNVTCTCYDSLIYAQQSKDNFFFPKGKTTKYCV